MTMPSQRPDDPDARPSPARMYDYFLGGSHNFPADRAAAEQIIALGSDVILVAQANRAFLRRAVTYLSEQGITQFLDLGSGIPTVGNVHEVAQGIRPDAHVVYVDIDPVAVTHSASLLAGNPTASVIQADARDSESILNHPEVRRLLDFSRPLGLLMVGFLYFIQDDADAERLVRSLRDALAPGSYVVISHALSEYAEAAPSDLVEEAEAVYNRSTNPYRLRSWSQIAQFFDGLELVEPGLVDLPLWHPEGPDDIFLDDPGRSAFVAGVGRKP